MTDFTTSLGGTFIDPFKEMKRVKQDGSQTSVGAAAAVAAGKGMQGMTTAVVKGSLVDFPLALADGLKNVPRLYGEEVRDHGPVTDWKSGGTVAAKVHFLYTEFCRSEETNYFPRILAMASMKALQILSLNP